MNSRNRGYRAWKSLRQAGVLTLLASACLAAGEFPVPEYRTPPGTFRRQYVRYHVGPLVAQANRLIEEGQYAAADQVLVRALDIDRENNHVKLMLARNSERVGKLERGIRFCDELLRDFPQAVELLFDKAYLGIKAGRDETAIAALEAYLDRAPEPDARRVEAWRTLAEAAVRAGQYDKAGRYADLWMKQDKDPRALIIVADSLSRQNRAEEALRVLGDAVSLARTAGQRGAIELKRGYLLTAVKDFPGAASAFRAAAEALPEDASVKAAVSRQLGMNALQSGDYAGAAAQFKLCLASGFEEGLAVTYLQSLMSAGLLEDAAEAAREWLAQGVFSAKGREAALRYRLFAMKHSGKNREYYEAATNLAAGGGAIAAREAGTASMRLSRYDEAAEWFARAQQTEFDEVTAVARLEALAEAGRWDACAGAAREALQRPLSAAGRTSVLRHLLYAEKNRGDNRAYQEIAGELLKSTDLAADIREAALAAGRMGQVEESIRLHKRSMDKEYSEPGAMAYLDALLAGSQWKTAEQEAETLLGRPDASAELKARALRARMYSRKNLGNVAGYLDAARDLMRVDETPVVFAEAALAAWRAGKLEESAKYYEESLRKQFDPVVALSHAFVLKLLNRGAEQEQLLLRVLNTAGVPEGATRAARYELAQICLQTRRIPDYLKLMDVVVKDSPEPSRLREYATQLYLTGESRRATELFTESLKTELSPARKYDLSMAIAELLLAVGKYEESRFWLNEACKHGKPDETWTRRIGRVEYEIGDFQAAAEHLSSLRAADDVSRLYAGFAFYRMRMPGLALYHLNRVASPGALSLAEQEVFYGNRAFLNYDQDQYPQALADADKALAIQRSELLQVARLRILLALGRNDEVLDASQLLADQITNVTLRADVLDLTGRAFDAGGNPEAAAKAFSAALECEPDRPELYYLRGMAYRKCGRAEDALKDLRTFQDKVEALPATYWGDRGVTEGLAGQETAGVGNLRKALGFFPCELDSMEELGYQWMRINETREARDAFRQAIDVYDEILPVMTGSDADAYRESRLLLKKQQTTLDKTFGLQAYLSKTDYNLSSNEVLLSIDGALPSQFGAEVSWRPPDIGFRNERIFEVFCRGLGNFEADSWTPDEQSYQGGAGARYKPFSKLNLNVSIERLFKIGDNAEENWLWRNMLSLERGTRPVQEASWWTSESVYGEVSYYLEAPERWICYVDGRAGLSFPLGPNGYFTLPQFMAVSRYQSDDPSGIGTYTLLGVGATARILQGEKKYALQGWYLDGFVHYTQGWFEDTPEGLDDRSFDGIIFGLNFVK